MDRRRSTRLQLGNLFRLVGLQCGLRVNVAQEPVVEVHEALVTDRELVGLCLCLVGSLEARVYLLWQPL